MADALPEASTIETSECLISYRDVGAGPVLLCLHGGGPGATGLGNFRGNVEDLRHRFRVIVPDHPGFGMSKVMKDTGASYATLSAQAMSELLTSLGIEKAHVLGNSMGGGVALRMAMQHRDLVDRLVLMGPWLMGFGIRLFAPEPVPLLQQYYPDPSVDKMRALIRAFVYDPDFPGADALIQSRYEASLDPEIESGYLRMSTGKDPHPDRRPLFDQLAALDNEALLLWGRDDRFCSLDDAFLYLAALPKSELVLFRNTGHWVQVERRREFAGYVSAFLTR